MESLLGDNLVILDHDMSIKKSICAILICLECYYCYYYLNRTTQWDTYQMAWHFPNKQLPSLLHMECYSTQCTYLDRQRKVVEPRDEEGVLSMECQHSEQGGWKHFHVFKERYWWFYFLIRKSVRVSKRQWCG